jgi:hypothetical protein
MTRSTWRAVGALAAVALVALLGACGGDDDAPSTDPGSSPPSSSATASGSGTTAPGGAGQEEGPVIVDAAEVVPGAAPVLDVRGQLPTACHEPSYEVEPGGDELAVRLFSLVDPAAMCAQAIQPFTLAVPLGPTPSAPVTVTLNGEAVGTLG